MEENNTVDQNNNVANAEDTAAQTPTETEELHVQESTKLSEKPSVKKPPQSTIRADKVVIDELNSMLKKFHFGSSNIMLKTLITDYELANAQAKIIDRQAEIDEFTLFTQKIREMYIKSLDMFQDVKEVVKSDFETKLSNNEEMIKTLRDAADKWKSESEYYKNRNEITETNLIESAEEIEALKLALKVSKESESRKDVIIESLTKLNPKSEQQEVTIKEQASQIDELRKQINQLEQQNREIATKLSQSEHDYIAKAKSDLIELETSRKEVKELQQQLYDRSMPPKAPIQFGIPSPYMQSAPQPLPPVPGANIPLPPPQTNVNNTNG